jgi:hypothetical protein
MRTPKYRKYANEQAVIIKQVVDILNLGGDGFYLYDLDNNKDMQKQIMDMVPEIWKYFPHVNITGLIYPEKCKRPWLSIVRGVIKNQYILKYRTCRYQIEGGSRHTMRYYLESKVKTTPTSTTGGQNTLIINDDDEIESSKITLTTKASIATSPEATLTKSTEPKMQLKIQRKSIDTTPEIVVSNN